VREKEAYFCCIARVLGRRGLLYYLWSEFVAIFFWGTPVFHALEQANQPIPNT